MRIKLFHLSHNTWLSRWQLTVCSVVFVALIFQKKLLLSMIFSALKIYTVLNISHNVISERLVESLRLPQVPILHAQVFLFFRVLLLRMSPQHLTSLWPTMITELVRIWHTSHICILQNTNNHKQHLPNQSVSSWPWWWNNRSSQGEYGEE